MPLTTYEQALRRFGLGSVANGLDLQLTKSGDIAVTRDGDLQLGNTQQNALFRMVERWRQSESAINELFGPTVRAVKQFDELTGAREKNNGPSLLQDPRVYHEVTDAILEAQLISSTLAGSISIVVNNLLQRLKCDLNSSNEDWHAATPTIATFSVGEIFSAAAANFRHYDEWAVSKKTLNSQQEGSMLVICSVLGTPLKNAHGFANIRTNVCQHIVMKVTDGLVENLHAKIFEFAKSLAKS